jgi:hypothetical protein
MSSVFFWLLSFGAKPLSWPGLDLVLHMTKWGAALGFIAGTGIWLTGLLEHRKHGIQKPRRPHTQRTWLVFMALACAAAALVCVLAWLGNAFLSRESLSLPAVDDVINIGLLVLVLGIVLGTMAWRPPRK